MSEYPPPVAALLSLGRIEREHWLDYRAQGIGPEHVPDLTRMLLDPDLNEGDPKRTAVWAPLHAARALGQLGAVEAAEALVRTLREDLARHGDWVAEDMPGIFALLGKTALPVLAATLRDPNEDKYVRWAVARSIASIGESHPEARAEAVDLLAGALARSAENDASLNGGLVSCLIDLKATETAGEIQRAFEAGQVDEFVVGGWEDVRFALGLGPPPPPRTRPNLLSRFVSPPAPRANSPKERAKERSRKRKQAKQNRKPK